MPEVGRWLHHGAIVATELAAHLDATRVALVTAANGSLARIRLLHLPNVTGLPASLAAGPAGSSGTMICEYSAAAAVAELHQRSLPAGMAWTTLSLGHEDGASFATQSANAAREAVTPFRAVLSAELTVAARALRISGWPGEGLRDKAAPLLGDLLDTVLTALPDELGDHDLGPELTLASELLPTLAEASLAVGSVDPLPERTFPKQGATP